MLAGDADALDAWYRAEHPQVYRLCLGVLADANEAEDVAQEAMLALHDKLGDWDPARPWRAWRNTLVLNRCRDRIRRKEARRRAEEGAAAAGLPDRLPHPEREAERAELHDALSRALALLAPREREAFVLRDLEGGSTKEAAEAMGIAEPTVRTLLTLARRRLREHLIERMPQIVPGEAS